MALEASVKIRCPTALGLWQGWHIMAQYMEEEVTYDLSQESEND
jgi:hypothetical protein